MADYFAILKRAVDGMPDGNREQRQAIYDKARKALLGQLQNMDPPLAASEISKQRVALEEAVRAVELDLMRQKEAQEASDPQPGSEKSLKQKAQAAAAPVATKAPKVEAVPEKAPSVELSSATLPEGANKETNKDVAVSDGGSDKKAVEQPVEPSAPAPSDKVVRRAGQDVLKNAVRDAKALGTATSAAVKSAQETADMVGEQRDSDVARIEPTLGDAVVSDSKTYKREPTSAVVSSVGSATQVTSTENEENKSGGFGVLVGVVLLAGLLGGSAYLLYQNKDAFLGTDGGSDTIVSQDETGASASKSTKKSDDAGIPAKTVRTVTVKPDGSTEDQSNTAPASGEAKSADQAPEEMAKADAKPTEVAVAQRSILYEEASAGAKSGSASAGETVWTLEGSGDDAAIIIGASIPDRGVEFSISIRKNKDAELPASHLIEISSVHTDAGEPRVIEKIPGLILKPTEQSRGEGLVGAAIRISDDLYWIALTAGERETKYNMELLELRSWIDIPIQYKSGRRAILTLEKGEKGDDVIKQAIKAWGQS